MQPVIFISKIPLHAGSIDDAIAAITMNVEASHREDGVLRMALHRQVDRPDRLVVVEIFRSEEEYQQHIQTPHFSAVVQALGPLVAGEVEAVRLEAIPVGDPQKGSLAGAL